MPIDLKDRIENSALAFRGYNITNYGRSAELLQHPVYGSHVAEALAEASHVCGEVLKRPADLARDVQANRPATLETFAEDIALIVAMEVAHIRLLEMYHDVDIQQADMAYGYSLGEATALVCGGVYTLSDILRPLITMAPDCAELGRDVTMGIVFSRGLELNVPAVYKLCLEINRQGQGVIGVSAELSPNTALVLGQGTTVERFAQRMPDVFPSHVHLRRNDRHWPPLHTPILWERDITCRAARLWHTVDHQPATPHPRVFSLATGAFSYKDYNSRDVLYRWLDHPQLLWEAVFATLTAGVGTIIHVGPEPNLIPATFRRIAENVEQQLQGGSPRSMGLRAVAAIWRPWIGKWLSSKSALLRAPYIEHVILEDWLLENAPT